MKQQRIALIALGLMGLTACDPYQSTMRPDYAIQVTPTASGGIATPPACPSWATETADPYDNQPLPQFGCATARNLAAMVERPNDLVQPRTMGEERGVTAVGAVRRYDNNQTRGFIWPGAETNQTATSTSSTTSSSMSGDITGGAGGSSAPAGAP